MVHDTSSGIVEISDKAEQYIAALDAQQARHSYRCIYSVDLAARGEQVWRATPDKQVEHGAVRKQSIPFYQTQSLNRSWHFLKVIPSS